LAGSRSAGPAEMSCPAALARAGRSRGCNTRGGAVGRNRDEVARWSPQRARSPGETDRRTPVRPAGTGDGGAAGAESAGKATKTRAGARDYTALDFYEKCVDEALAVFGGADPQPVLESRLERVRRDAKRYWRIACPEGRPFLSYVDNLKLAVETGIHKRLELEAATVLSIIPVMLIPPGLDKR